MDPIPVEKMNVWQRMHHAACAINTRIAKASSNTQQGYKYASHDDVVAIVRGPLLDARIAVTISTAEINVTQVEIPRKTGPVTEFLAQGLFRMRVTNIDDPADHYEIDIPAYANDPGDKALGKMISYAKKYGLVAMAGMCLATGEDQDADTGPTRAPSTVPPPPATKKDIAAEIGRIANAWGCDNAALKAHIAEKYKKSSSGDMAMPHLTAWRDKLAARAERLTRLSELIGAPATQELLAQHGGILNVDVAFLDDAVGQAERQFGQEPPDPRAERYAEACMVLQSIGGAPEDLTRWLEARYGCQWAAAQVEAVDEVMEHLGRQVDWLLPHVDAAGGPSKFRAVLKAKNTTALDVMPEQMEG